MFLIYAETFPAKSETFLSKSENFLCQSENFLAHLETFLVIRGSHSVCPYGIENCPETLLQGKKIVLAIKCTARPGKDVAADAGIVCCLAAAVLWA